MELLQIKIMYARIDLILKFLWNYDSILLPTKEKLAKYLHSLILREVSPNITRIMQIIRLFVTLFTVGRSCDTQSSKGASSTITYKKLIGVCVARSLLQHYGGNYYNYNCIHVLGRITSRRFNSPFEPCAPQLQCPIVALSEVGVSLKSI